MKKFILILIPLLIFGCSKNKDEIMHETVKGYLQELHKKNNGVSYELVSVDIKFDTIPEYFFNDAIFGSRNEVGAANKAANALKFLKDMNSPNVQMMTEITGRPYSWGGVGGGYYEEDAYADLENLQNKLDLIKSTTTPATGYVACIVEKLKFEEGLENEDREIIILDKDDPTKVLKYYSFYGIGIDEMAAIKFVQSIDKKYIDALGRINTNDWYNVEKFILSDRLKQFE